ncbi:MAG: UbiA prenyltransferase family protein [Thermoplasmatales archaeon]|nr:UbiA prenyltransferase family protein [Thermoplasmatales archaeon]
MIKEYLKLSRSFNVGLTALAPVLGAFCNGERNLIYLFLFFLVGFFGHCYGFALNDIVDYRVDALSDELKERPLVSGKIKIRDAWIFTLLMLFISLSLGFFISYLYSNFYAFSILVFSAISITVYDFISKKYPAMDIFVALGIFLLILYGAFAVNKDINEITWITSALGTIQVLFMQFIAGGLKDAEHDYKAKAKTLAIKLGVRVEKKIFIPLSFKFLAYSLQFIYLFFIFYPFYKIFEHGLIQIIILSILSILMLYISHKLLSIKKFVRDEVRKYIGMHYYINFSLVPIMLTAINPFIFFLAFIPPLAFIISNIAIHKQILPKTM